MELNHLRVFFEVAKIGSFTEAARKLNISQSALSRSVALLEESENVLLFERSKRGLSLTPLGSEVFRKCQELFQVFGKIEQVVRGTKEECEGPLRFATTDHIMNHLLINHLQSFQRDFPVVVPSVTAGTPDEIIDKLLRADIEFGLLFAKVLSPQIDYKELSEEPMALVVSSEVWRANRSNSQAATLNKTLDEVGYIGSIGATAQTRSSRVLLELFGKMPRIAFEANSQETQKRVCLAGGGVAYLSKFMVEDEIHSGELHEVNVDHPHVFKLWLAVRKGRVLSLQAKTFLDHLKSKL